MPYAGDQAADAAGVELVRWSRLYAFPDFVKAADFEATTRPPGAAATIYADPAGRRFPCHTPAATWLSALSFQEKRAEIPAGDQARIAARLDQFADYHRVTAAVADLREAHAAREKAARAALPDSAYAYVWVDESGRKDRRLPLTSAPEVKAAADWLHTHRDQIPYPDRRAIATRVLEKQAEFAASVGPHREFLERQAGLGVCDPDAVVRLIEGRAALARNPEAADGLRKLAAVVRDAPRRALAPDRLVKLAATLDEVDRALGLVGSYGDVLRRPEDVLFAATFGKAAEELRDQVETVTGSVYEKEAFRKVALHEVRDLLGDEFARRVSDGFGVDPEKFAEELGVLPRPDCELVEGLLRDRGVRPVLAKAGAAVGLSQDEWAALAEEYAG